MAGDVETGVETVVDRTGEVIRASFITFIVVQFGVRAAAWAVAPLSATLPPDGAAIGRGAINGRSAPSSGL
jgi:hypothetical protein